MLDLVEHLPGPRFGLLGPWAHGYPHATDPGPQIDFLGECARFFGRYLRDDPNGYEHEPALRAYVQEYDVPAALQRTRRGRWIATAGVHGQPVTVLALGATGSRRSPGRRASTSSARRRRRVSPPATGAPTAGRASRSTSARTMRSRSCSTACR